MAIFFVVVFVFNVSANAFEMILLTDSNKGSWDWPVEEQQSHHHVGKMVSGSVDLFDSGKRQFESK